MRRHCTWAMRVYHSHPQQQQLLLLSFKGLSSSFAALTSMRSYGERSFGGGGGNNNNNNRPPQSRVPGGGFGGGGGGGGRRNSPPGNYGGSAGGNSQRFGGGGGGNFNNSSNNSGPGGGGGGSPLPPPRIIMSAAGDTELSPLTLRAMRDDTRVLQNIFEILQPNSAISIKSLTTQLSEEVQEALSEKHGGLRNFLNQRKQLFVVKEREEDHAWLVAATPLAHQRFSAREMQKTTMVRMLGLEKRKPNSSGSGGGRGNYNNNNDRRNFRGGNSGGGGGRYQRDGNNNNEYSGSSSNNSGGNGGGGGGRSFGDRGGNRQGFGNNRR